MEKMGLRLFFQETLLLCPKRVWWQNLSVNEVVFIALTYHSHCCLVTVQNISYLRQGTCVWPTPAVSLRFPAGREIFHSTPSSYSKWAFPLSCPWLLCAGLFTWHRRASKSTWERGKLVGGLQASIEQIKKNACKAYLGEKDDYFTSVQTSACD